MLPQYVITLGARTAFRVGTKKNGKFDESDYKKMERIVRVQSGFEGCTIIRARGIYQGKGEDTVQIVILEADYGRIKECAEKLRKTFGQRSVLVASSGMGEFLTSEGEQSG